MRRREEAAGGQGRALREDGKKTEAVRKKKGTNPRHVGVAGINHVIALAGSRGPIYEILGDQPRHVILMT
jgi:hypothetical protein